MSKSPYLKKILKKSKKRVRNFKMLKSVLKNRKKIGSAIYSVIYLAASKKS